MKQSLPLVDPARIEFGFSRTRCDCLACTRSCQHIPGYLIPADLEQIHRHLAPDEELLVWAKRYSLASAGALVMSHGKAFRIRTLVPARQLGGICIFLTADGRCSIHAVSPFGCAFFDSHMPYEECDHRSKRGLQSVLGAWNASAIYTEVWVALASDGLVALPPEVVRQQLRRSCNNQLQQGESDGS